jgi:ubiquinone/menaquinone biosynthesis C-methylase UbiE
LSSLSSNGSGFDEVDKHEDKQYFVDYLDSVRSQEMIRAAKEHSFSLLNLKPGDNALDVGCGKGEDVISLAKIVGENGRAVGIDNSEAMISEARKRSAKLNMTNAQFVLGNAYAIDFPDEAFNGCKAERVFVHLQEPKKALKEIIRVTKKGNGNNVVFDADWDTLTLDSEFKEITRRVLRMISDELKNGWSGRKLHGMFKDAGLMNVGCHQVTGVHGLQRYFCSINRT